MKVVIINKSDSTGGAAVVSMRLLEALVAAGVDCRMIVAEKRSDSNRVAVAGGKLAMKRAFLTERLGIFLCNGFSRRTLFRIDTASEGMALWKHPWVCQADVVCLNWINQGLLSLSGIRKIAGLGKPIVWTMHDMWNMTGVCHHAGTCANFLKGRNQCRGCYLYGKSPFVGQAHDVWYRKELLYSSVPISFVAVSSWLARRCAESELMSECNVRVIPNAFSLDGAFGEALEKRTSGDGKTRLIFGAARLDDSIKGFDILIESLRILSEINPELARNTELNLFGNIRDISLIDRIPVSCKSHSVVSGQDELAELYRNSDIVLSTSHYETLPGTLIEGQACGCIPVAFNSGGQSDIIEHEETGFLAERSDDLSASALEIAKGIVWAAGQPEAIRKQLRKSVETRFSSAVVAKAYLELFRMMQVGR